MQRIVFLGPPGSGKGTYAKHCARILNAEHISTGDLIRAESLASTSLGRTLKTLSDKGLLVPDELMMQILNPVIQGSKPLIFDGFPRTVPQAKLLQQICPIQLVISITMRKDILMRKSLGRRVCPKCNTSFNIEHVEEPDFLMPAILPTAPKCIASQCIEQTIHREDDTEEVILKRLELFEKETKPILEYYQSLSKAPTIKNIQIKGGFDLMAPKFERAVKLSQR